MLPEMSASQMEFTVLGSGSGGNAFAVRADENTLLIDAGFSCRELCTRLERAGIAPSSICAVLLTHDHSDHSCGCRVFCDKMHIPLYAPSQTATYLEHRGALPWQVYEFEPGADFEIGAFSVRSFPVSHDACDPVGFVLEHHKIRLGLATDLGMAGPQVCHALANADMLVFEANYDDEMLDHSARPYSLKQRIRSRQGHLSNADAFRILPQLIGEATRMLTLVHVSRECNRYDLVEHLAGNMLEKIHRQDIFLKVARQDESGDTFCWGTGV